MYIGCLILLLRYVTINIHIVNMEKEQTHKTRATHTIRKNGEIFDLRDIELFACDCN